jgi:hypothetical protein
VFSVKNDYRKIDRPDGKRRVEFFQNPDGTFSFEELFFLEREEVFCPVQGSGKHISRTPSMDDAVREAKGRIPWLSEASLIAPVSYQLTWKILPGLRGISCSEFGATPTAAPNNEQGVAVECSTETERDSLLRELEVHFAPQRFSNNASAFETVKTYVLERAARKTNS